MQPEKTKKPDYKNQVQPIDKVTQNETTMPAKTQKKSNPKVKTPKATEPASPPARKSAPKKTAKAASATTADGKASEITPTKKATKTKAPASRAPKKSSVKKTVQLFFKIAFTTKFGQVIKLGGNHPVFGDGSDDKALELNFADTEHWSGQTILDRATIPVAGLEYYYLIQQADGTIDKSSPYKLKADSIPVKATRVLIQDAWNSPAFLESAFSTDVFKVLLNKTGSAEAATSAKKRPKNTAMQGTHLFSVKAPALPAGQVICLSGDHAALGSWDPAKVTLLQPDSSSNAWQTSLQLSSANGTIQYKYGIYDTAAGAFLFFESGDNRVLTPDEPAVDQVQINDGFVRTH